MRLLVIGLLALATVSGAAKVSVAGDFRAVSGQLSYVHGPVFPNPEQLCEGPIPGFLLADIVGEFKIEAEGLSLEGFGTADSCAYFEPFFGIYAHYSGTAELMDTTTGKTLHGTFFGLDLEPIAYVGEQPAAFETVAVLRLTDDNGDFAGLITAVGIDSPFDTPGGVFASFDGFIVVDND